MAGQRVGLFGPHDHPALLACASVLMATGNRPLFRNENVFNSHVSQQEDFTAIVIIGDSPAAEAVAVAHEEREIPVYVIGANVGVANEAGQIAEPLAESSALVKLVEMVRIGAEGQKSAIDSSLESIGVQPAVAENQDAVLGRELVSLLLPHAGERGTEEGAVETLTRVIGERDECISVVTRLYQQGAPNEDGLTILTRIVAERDAAIAQLDATQSDTSLPKIVDLAAHLATLDLDAVTALQARDSRKTAAPLYEARLEELTRPTGS